MPNGGGGDLTSQEYILKKYGREEVRLGACWSFHLSLSFTLTRALH